MTYGCFAGCGERCTDDRHCGSAGCGSCKEGKCVVLAPPGPAPTCGGVCNDGVTDCDPQAECNLCMPHPPGQGMTYGCFAGCGERCTDDRHCGSAGCGSCQEGKCVVPPTTPAPAPKCGGVC